MPKKQQPRALVLLWAIALNIAGLSGTQPTAAQSASGIGWLDYSSGISTSNQQQRPAFLEFYYDWCSHCQWMEQNTFANQDIISMISTNFVPIRLNMDDASTQQFADKYQVTATPTMIILDANGVTIDTIVGERAPTQLMDALQNMVGTSRGIPTHTTSEPGLATAIDPMLKAVSHLEQETFGHTFKGGVTSRIERLEQKRFGGPHKGAINQRIDALKQTAAHK